MRLDRGEVVGARLAQVLGDPRGRGVHLGHRRVLRVEQAERVALQALALGGRQAIGAFAVVRGQRLDVGGPAGRVADRVERHLDVRQARVPEEPRRELDDLRIDRRTRVADRLDVELPELAVAPGLRPVVAEHRTGLGQLHRLRPGLHPVLDVGADDAGGRLRPERPRLAVLGPRREPEQLLLDDVGDLADPALEDVGLLEQRRLDALVAVARREVGGQPFEARPRRRLGRQEVAGAAWGSEGGHRPSLAAGRVLGHPRRGQPRSPSSPEPTSFAPMTRNRTAITVALFAWSHVFQPSSVCFAPSPPTSM